MAKILNSCSCFFYSLLLFLLFLLFVWPLPLSISNKYKVYTLKVPQIQASLGMVVWKVSRLHPVTRFKLWGLGLLNRDKELTSNLKTPFSSKKKLCAKPRCRENTFKQIISLTLNLTEKHANGKLIFRTVVYYALFNRRSCCHSRSPIKKLGW